MSAPPVVYSIGRLEGLGPLLAGHRRFSRAWLAFVALCLIGGASLRLTNLGKFGFWTDEYFHVFAAKSYLEDGSFFVPMVGDYNRAKAVTLTTAAMFGIFGESEFTARLPFALANVAFLGLLAIVTRRVFSEMVSAAAVFCLAFSPLAIEISRECRFYTAHQLFYFAAAWALFAGFENVSGRASRSGRKLPVDWRWLAASVPLAGIALHLQALTVNLGLVAGFYLVSMAVAVGIRHGWLKGALSKYGIVIALGVAGAAALVVMRPDFIRDELNEAVKIHSWQLSKGYDSRFYRYYFTDNLPALTFLFPVGVYVAIRRYGKTGLFAVCSSAPLLLIHSFVFARKSERYIFYLLPFFIIVAVIAVEPVLEWAWQRLRESLRSEPFRAKLVAAAFVMPGFLVLAHPWIVDGVRKPFRSKHPDWKSVDEQFARNLRSATVFTTNPQAFLYYIGKYPEYYRLAEIRRGHEYEPTLIRSSAQFSEVLRSAKGELYVVGAEWNFHNEGFMTPEMRNAVQYLMSPVDHGGDRRILAYHR